MNDEHSDTLQYIIDDLQSLIDNLEETGSEEELNKLKKAQELLNSL